ncbi:hypothetical protein ACET3Z_012267 [Daucus carota]
MILQGLSRYLGEYNSLFISPVVAALSASHKSSRKLMGSDPGPLIPPEVIESEILTRLPVKSLLRFKSVCKSWNLLITDHNFITRHHDLRVLDEDAVIIWNRFYHEIIGCIKGLVCFYIFTGDDGETMEISVWNPATKQRLKVPPVPDEHDSDWYPEFLGFGYDSAANDFKVVYSKVFDNMEEPQPIIGYVYSCKSGCWRKIAPSNFLYNVGIFRYCCRYTIVDGSPYWLVESLQSLIVIKFDIQLEVFRLLPEFCPIDSTKDKVCLITNLRDSLVLMLCDKRSMLNGQVGVYFYNEKCGIWSKTSIGEFMNKEPTPPGMQRCRLVECFGSGNVLFVSDDLRLTCINLKSCEIKNLRNLGREGYLCMSPCYDGCEYSESLVFIEGMKSAVEDDCDGVFFLTPFALNLIRKESCRRTSKELDEAIEAAEKDVKDADEVEA